MEKIEIGSSWTIRPIKASDNKRLAEIIRAVFIEFDAPQEGTVYSDPTTDNLFTLFQDFGSILWLVEYQGEVFGCCGIYPTAGLPDHCVELVKFYLHPSVRNRGIGKALLLQCLNSARKLAYNSVYIESLPEFDKAVAMYKKLGFKALEKPLTSFGHTGCDLWFVKDL